MNCCFLLLKLKTICNPYSVIVRRKKKHNKSHTNKLLYYCVYTRRSYGILNSYGFNT